LGKPLEAALLLRKGLTPYEISISPEWTGGKNLDTILSYLDRAIGEKIPYGDPLTKAELLYSIPRTRRELVQKAISASVVCGGLPSVAVGV
jgi:hypothetical protein